MGYDNLNLNCGFQDFSGMREVLYYDISRAFAPALKGCFVDLYINGQYWGPYNNIQQIEGKYVKEWFSDNEGTRWRAVKPDGVGGGGPGPGGGFGTGVSTLNYNGPDSTDYNQNYTLKYTTKENPWEDLIKICDKLNNQPIASLYDSLKQYLDIDRTLWFLAQEVVFSDDDSYIYKGGMDYYVYWDHATDRIIPLEVDGNSVMVMSHVNWSPFYHEEDANFPLLNRFLQNSEVRQRYLAHLRTILAQHFIAQNVHQRIDQFAAILDERVQNDPKKIYSYSQFLNGVQELKNFVSNRINFLANNNEINREGLTINSVNMETAAGTGNSPQANEAVKITANITGDAQKVLLYYGEGFDGAFERVQMYDDGMHNDQLAGDHIYGANIPAFSANKYVRYYIEAIKNDNFSTATYYPAGAEHDVFVYQVEPANLVAENVVINEFMADNKAAVADMAGEYDDWIELYNKGNAALDLSGYYLSDNENNITKWQFPANTVIQADGYLIVWADNDETQATAEELHANFKLSADGEVVVLANTDEEIIDIIAFGTQQEDVAFARLPNGTGEFQFNGATFNANNNAFVIGVENIVKSDDFAVYPNPASHYITLNMDLVAPKNFEVKILNATAQLLLHQRVEDTSFPVSIDVSGLDSGIYFLLVQDLDNNVLYQQKIVVLK